VPNPDTYTFATDIQPDGDVDPVDCSGNICREVLLNTLDTLVWYPNATLGVPQPLLADNYTISSNGLNYTFHIRSGVKFHDGNPVKPIDVQYSIGRFLAVSNPNGYVSLLEPYLTGAQPGKYVSWQQISQAIAIDNSSNTVTFNLKTPDAAFLSNLGQVVFGIYEASYAVQHGSWKPGQNTTGSQDQNMMSGHNLMGSGPFSLTQYVTGQKYVLTSNDAYWRGPAHIKTMVIQYVPEWSTALLMLQRGQADAADLPAADVSQVQNKPGMNFFMANNSGFTEGIFFNFNLSLSNQPPGTKGVTSNWLSNKDLRMAFASAFPYQQYLQQAYLGYSTPATGYIPPGELGYTSSYPYSYNVTKATQLFKEAWNGSVWANGFTITFGYQQFQQGPGILAGQLLAQSLQQINPKFHLNVQQGNWPTLLGWPLFLAVDQNGPDPSWLGDVYASTGTFPSFTGYYNATLQGILGNAQNVTGSAQRQALYAQANTIIGADIPVVLTTYYPYLMAYRSYVHGYVYSPAWNINAGYGWYISKS
jgi:peptide/nickel transport system substrate-binding protein